MLTEHSEVISLQQDDRFVDYIDPILNINTNILKPETNRYKNKLIEDSTNDYINFSKIRKSRFEWNI
jgi:hypothetical protein